MLECAFCKEAKSADAAGIEAIVMGDKLQISVPCDSSCRDTTYSVQASSSLESNAWTDIDQSVGDDSKFKHLGLDPADYVNNLDAVIAILVKHKQLLQRPVLVKGSKAIVGRPKERIAGFLS